MAQLQHGWMSNSMARLQHHWMSMAHPGGVTLLDDYSTARGAMHGQIMASLDECGMARQVRHHRTITAWPGEHSTAGRVRHGWDLAPSSGFSRAQPKALLPALQSSDRSGLEWGRTPSQGSGTKEDEGTPAMGCPRHVVHAFRSGPSVAIAWAHGDWAVHGKMAMSASRSWGSLALAPLDQQNCPVLPDVVGGAEASGLPAQPGQHEPPLALHPHQLRVTQHLLHQLLVPPDACGRILWRKGRSHKCLTWGLTWGLSQHRTGTAAPQAGAEGTGNSPTARSSQSGSSYAKFWATGVKCCCGCTADGHFGNVPSLCCCHPCYLCPCQRVGVPQCLDAALQQLQCPLEAGCEGLQLLWGTHMVGQWRQPAREEEEKEEQCQDRSGKNCEALG